MLKKTAWAEAHPTVKAIFRGCLKLLKLYVSGI